MIAAVQAPVDQDLAAQQPAAPAKMTVPQLKEQLKTFNMPVSGKKADLVHRLETALAAAAASGHASDAASPATHAVPADRRAAEPAAASASGSDSGMARDGDAISHEAMSPAGSHATASQQSMTSLEVAALSEGDEREPEGAAAHEEEVRPGIEGLGDVATFEVGSYDRETLTSKGCRHGAPLLQAPTVAERPCS